MLEKESVYILEIFKIYFYKTFWAVTLSNKLINIKVHEMQQFNILHILATVGHNQKATPKHCLKGISTVTNQDRLNTNVIKVS
jgi:hypothetical protein